MLSGSSVLVVAQRTRPPGRSSQSACSLKNSASSVASDSLARLCSPTGVWPRMLCRNPTSPKASASVGRWPTWFSRTPVTPKASKKGGGSSGATASYLFERDFEVHEDSLFLWKNSDDHAALLFLLVGVCFEPMSLCSDGVLLTRFDEPRSEPSAARLETTLMRVWKFKNGSKRGKAERL